MSAPIRPDNSRVPVETRTDNRHNADPDYAIEAELIETPEPLPPIEPIPVYQVEIPPSRRVLKRWTTGTMTLTGLEPEQLAADDRHRTRLVVMNTETANAVYLTEKPVGTSTAFARLLPFGKEVEMLHNQGVWAFTGSGLTAVVTWHAEYEVDDE